ncbi:MAG: hypothetical protein AUK53_10470 [Betaproteobacteria bacterium CG2_30_59_46]|nr:MAG: hypothetical protein AUK53_10470 [Betaproteobacteria bacterium CG2_30_59_46]PIY01905.1 MAG: hypothetical protein COZ23_00720 [Hydrogenophilales bacterium CG_4_10_14_3_um_filter_58_23]
MLHVQGLPTGYGYKINLAANDLTFTTTAAVPEPENYLMMALGLLLVGFAHRRNALRVKTSNWN